MTPKQWFNPCKSLLICLLLYHPTADGNPRAVKKNGERQAPAKAAQAAPKGEASAPRFQDLLGLYGNLEDLNWKALSSSLERLKGTNWPEPLGSLRRDLLRASLYGAFRGGQNDLVRLITSETTFASDLPAGVRSGGEAQSGDLQALQQSAKKLNLSEKLTQTGTKDKVTSVEKEKEEKIKSPPESKKQKKKRVVSEQEKLAALREAWRSGRTQDAYRLAGQFSFNPHRKSCQAAWVYAQFVLGRVARSGQDRKVFFKHQQEVGKSLFAARCLARHFAMDEKTFAAFRLDELNWTARLFWENADLNEARRYSERALVDAIETNQTGAALEALQVLYGRIGFEIPDAVQSLTEMEQWKRRVTGQAARSNAGGSGWRALVSWLEQRMALFEFQARRYDQCTQRLSTELKDRLNDGPVDTWEKRRHISQLAYWQSRCAALGNDPQAPEIIALAGKLVRHFAPTGYYSMLLDGEGGAESTPGIMKPPPSSSPELNLETTQWPQPPLRDPNLFAKLDEFVGTMKSEPEIAALPPTHPLNLYVTRWVLDLTSDQEHFIFAHSAQTFSKLAELLNQLKRHKDLILSAGRLSRFVDLSTSGADPILKALFPPAWLAEFRQAGQLCTIDWKLLYAVARQESLFDPYAVSPAGARGVLQVMPFVWKAFFQKLPPHLAAQRLQKSDPFDPRSNIIAGACHLKETLKHYGGNLTHALAGYNAGQAAVDQWIARRPTQDMELYIEFIPYAETQDYVKRILRTVHQLKQFPL